MKKYIFLVGLISILTATAIAQPPNGTYTLESIATGRRVAAGGERLYPAEKYDNNTEKWTLKLTGTYQSTRKVYTLTSVETGKCLDGDADHLYLSDANGGHYQKWIFDPVPECEDCYTLTSLATQKRLDGNVTDVYPSGPNSGNYQKWRVRATKVTPVTPSVDLGATATVQTTGVIAAGRPGLQSAIQNGDWSAWQPCGFGKFRWRWSANTISSDFPKFITVVYEVQNTRKSPVKAKVGMRQCQNPETVSKYQQEFTIGAETTETYKVTALNCGTKEQPTVTKPYVFELIRID
jgi:Ricin-type beta-trefoil lectin domain-like